MRHKTFIKQIFSVIVKKIYRFQVSSFKFQEVGFKFQASSFREIGITLYLAILIMVVTLAIALGLSTILFTQIRTVRGLENSVIAFSAADSGIERVLEEGANATDTVDYSFYLDNNASSTPQYVATTSADCPDNTENFCINSRGTYGEFQRAIQITR